MNEKIQPFQLSSICGLLTLSRPLKVDVHDDFHSILTRW